MITSLAGRAAVSRWLLAGALAAGAGLATAETPSRDAVANGTANGAANDAARPLSRVPNFRLEIDAPSELVEPLRTQTLAGRWRTEPGFDPGQLGLFVERAREEAVAIAQAAGFFSASVRVTEEPPVDGLPGIRIEVDAGARTTVARLELVVEGGAADTPLQARLRDRWPLPEGSFFRTEQWELGKRQLLEQLQQVGYLRARIAESRAEVDPEATSAALSLRLDSGPRVAFGPVTVRGLGRYPRSIVDALQPWDQGDGYSFDALLNFQARLRVSGYFAGVTVLPDLAALESDPQRGAVPITVELVERQTQRLTAGIGYSTDQGVRGLAGYDHRNLLGRGWLFESGALVEQIRRRLFATVSTPWDDTGHRYQSGARLERLDVSGELTETRTLYAGRGKRTNDIEWFLSLQYQNERRSIVVEGAPDVEWRNALTLGYSWNLRRLDSRVDPRDGWTFSAQVSAAAKGLGSDRSFLRLYGRAMRFWSMPRESSLAGGVLVGILEGGWVIANSSDNIPSENLFRAGGAQSLRGYDFLSLGVREGDAIVGGRVLGIGSLEYQHPITGNWYGAAFYDVGNAADSWNGFRVVHGMGVGVRWRSPIGPVNVDLAYGDAERAYRLHFSVGYTF
jgi:translocation and assembly module TamA